MNNIHSSHCRACKERVHELLTAIFCQCRVGYRFPWSARPEDYAGTAIGDCLRTIHSALAGWRGHGDFVKSAQVPPCDFYVSDPPFILEFDESQHFSAVRLLTLGLYPAAMRPGFSLRRWQNLCREINAIDDEPFDRDERRAWYDTLRDLVPIVHGFEPTVRLYADDCDWCGLDAANSQDLDTFKKFLPLF